MPLHESGAVLLVDDQPDVLTAVRRALATQGHRVSTARSVAAARAVWEVERPDVVVTDIGMPGETGMELLAHLRAADPDLPVLLMTGAPTLDSAITALDAGAVGYLLKPLSLPELYASVGRSVRLGRLARARRALVEGRPVAGAASADDLDAALEKLWLAWQPIVRWSTRTVHAWEALVRSDHASLRHPGVLIPAAEQLGRLPDLGRSIRARVVAPPDALAFVNLHPLDLLDEALFDPDSPFAALAPSIVLEITERASLDRIPEAARRIRRLKSLGFRVAIDDLGAGYAGLSAFTSLDPDVAKLDMSLVRGIDQDPIRRRLVSAFVPLCADLGITLVCEGIETAGERDTLVDLGCDLFQGYLFARPGRTFPMPAWG